MEMSGDFRFSFLLFILHFGGFSPLPIIGEWRVEMALVGLLAISISLGGKVKNREREKE